MFKNGVLLVFLFLFLGLPLASAADITLKAWKTVQLKGVTVACEPSGISSQQALRLDSATLLGIASSRGVGVCRVHMYNQDEGSIRIENAGSQDYVQVRDGSGREYFKKDELIRVLRRYLKAGACRDS